LKIFDVEIEFAGDTHHIHTTKCGESNAVNLVFLHGYGGSNVTFYRMIKTLSDYFCVWCVDFIGMGLSSRPKYNLKNTEDAISLFIDSIEEWRKKAGLQRFLLIGHSLGGYLAINYALKFKENIIRMFLISPAGVTYTTEEEAKEFEENLSKAPFMRRMFVKLVKKVSNKKHTPNSLYKKTGFLGKYMLNKYITKRWTTTEAESKVLFEYFSNLLSLPEGTEGALHDLLGFPRARALYPVEKLIIEKFQKIPIHFFFGSHDWMDTRGAKRILESEKVTASVNIIKNAGHHINMDNPESLIEFIVGYSVCDRKMASLRQGVKLTQLIDNVSEGESEHETF
jgi:pimeloyl-ACP methyl ester carboxylesterase